MRWIERLEETEPGWDGPTVWTFGGPSGVHVEPRPEDLAHAARRRDPARRAATLDRRLALRALAGRVLSADTADVEVAQKPDGGPRIASPAPLFASAAARGRLTALAISPRPIGVDIERIEPGTLRPLDLLHPALAARLAGGGAEAAAAAWAGLEACLKLTGEGIGGLAGVALANGVAIWEGGVPRAVLDDRRLGDWIAAVARFRA